MKASNFITQTDWLDFFNEAWTELYDILIESSDNYFVAETYITLLPSGGTDYDLPTDFYKLYNADLEINAASNTFCTIRRFTEAERNNTIGNVSSLPNGRVRLRYYPQPTRYTSADLTTDIESYANWEKMVIARMAIMALDAEESNSDRLSRQFAEYKRNITEASQERDYHLPGRISDIHSVQNSIYYPTIRYNLYGNQIRFLSTVQMGV